MNTFAFIIHPINPKQDVSRKYPLLGRLLSERQIDFFSTFFPPVFISEIDGIISTDTGGEIRGYFVACPLTPRRMHEVPEEVAYSKIIQSGRLAERLGAQMLGLGAFTSVVGDAGLTVARNLHIPVTTGNAYTISVAVQALTEAAQIMDIPLETAPVAVIGANGAIGRVCAELLSNQVSDLFLIGRRLDALEEVRDRLMASHPRAQIHVSTRVEDIRHALLILSVTSAAHNIIRPSILRSGSVILDVALPPDVSARVSRVRPDVLVIDGGLVDVPGPVNFRFDFGLPEGKAYACMAETMALTLEGRFESYTLGRQITLKQVQEITQLAEKHGFHLSGLRSQEQPVWEADIRRVRQAARQSRLKPVTVLQNSRIPWNYSKSGG